jgi:hypothetical protein
MAKDITPEARCAELILDWLYLSGNSNVLYTARELHAALSSPSFSRCKQYERVAISPKSLGRKLKTLCKYYPGNFREVPRTHKSNSVRYEITENASDNGA